MSGLSRLLWNFLARGVVRVTLALRFGDDAEDALRYLVATKARAVVQRKLRGL